MPESSLYFRFAQPADYQILTQLSRQTYLESYSHHPANTPEDEARLHLHIAQHFTPEILHQELQHSEKTFWLVEENGEALAYAKIIRGSIPEKIKDKNALHLDKIYVLKAQHQRGIGKKLLLEIEKIARQEQYEWLWLTVWEANEPAVKFYLHNGFVRAGSHIFVMGNHAYEDSLMLKKL
ncbi:MAG: GNAT family N-acetyltransferase [Microscillaceae bacterium]|jgi:ribosomal protein S18 acetylase RimI-like enzyme|nr:GNAT family N-acetyltransferase [Microscillaceae bacterium]